MADEGGVSYEMLLDLLRAERRSNKLMPVPARFWPQVRDFLQAVTEAFRIEQAKDPFSRKVMLLTDEVKNARHAAQSLWAIRERKLAMMALAMDKERKAPEGLTVEESQLYQAIVGVLDASRTRVLSAPPQFGSVALPAQAASMPAPSAAAVPALAVPAPPSVTSRPPPAPEPALTPTATPAAASPVVVPADTPTGDPLVTIRALGDIPPFVGPDMQTYLLKSGDIATVPPSIANLLVKRKKAAAVDA